MKYLIVMAVLVTAATATHGRQEVLGWRELTPLRSTRMEVERLLGPPLQGSMDVYETKNDYVSVIYSDGQCEEGRAGAWNVPADKVTTASTPEDFSGWIPVSGPIAHAGTRPDAWPSGPYAVNPSNLYLHLTLQEAA